MSVQPAVSIEEICRRATITAEDVLRLRRLLYTDVVISEEEARALFTLDAQCRTQDPSWRDFFIQAVTGTTSSTTSNRAATSRTGMRSG